jgi:predicted Zn finger-like uncharacterized protein
MYSQCPECQARFRVSAEALRAAHGTVRCGRCGSAFDALARLSDTVPPAAGPSPVERNHGGPALVSVTPDAVITTEYHFSADDLEKVFIDARDWQKQFGGVPTEAATVGTEPAGTGAEPPVVEVDEKEGIEDITLEGERIRIEPSAGFDVEEVDLDATDEFQILQDVPDSAYVDEEESAPEVDEGSVYIDMDTFREMAAESLGDDAAVAPRTPVAPGPAAAAAASVAPATPTATPRPAARPAAQSTLAEQRWRRERDETAVSLEEDVEPEKSSWSVLAWTLGSLVLTLALLAQLTHHFRQDLVRHPQIGPAVRTAYERLGLPLSPDWDLSAFELRQWGNDSAASTDGRMSVRASLTNRASFPQPHPVLRLELEDRFGEPVAVRDFEPGEYLKDPSQAARMMGAGATTEAELLIADPGRDAVGYRLDICVRESATLLRCAQGQG